MSTIMVLLKWLGYSWFAGTFR